MKDNHNDDEDIAFQATREEELVDQYVTETCVMDARLSDHFTTFDQLRNARMNDSLSHLGFSTNLSEHDEIIRSFLTSHIERYENHMANYLRYGHVVLTYIILEDRLYSFGKTIHAIDRGTHFDPDRYKSKNDSDSTLARFDRYLQAHAIPPPANDEIERLRLIRNCVVHANGRVTGIKKKREAQKIRDMLPDLTGINLDADDCLDITTEGCLILQEGMMKYLRALFEAADFRMWLPATGWALPNNRH